jgi:hypothetical protein
METGGQGSPSIKDKYYFVLGDIYEIIVTPKPIKQEMVNANECLIST